MTAFNLNTLSQADKAYLYNNAGPHGTQVAAIILGGSGPSALTQGAYNPTDGSTVNPAFKAAVDQTRAGYETQLAAGHASHEANEAKHAGETYAQRLARFHANNG